MAQTEAVDTVIDQWEMYASADEEGSPYPLRHFGPLGFAQQDTTATRVLRIWLTIPDEPDERDYWAWLDLGTEQPCCIGATEQEMTQRFLVGQPDARGPREEQEVGLGEILRLRITVLGEMYLRATSRHSWKISSAL